VALLKTIADAAKQLGKHLNTVIRASRQGIDGSREPVAKEAQERL
jgi:hypothetical protein